MSTPDRPERPDASWPLPPDPFVGIRGWVPGSAWARQQPVPEKGQDAALTTDDVLRCREQAVYAAAMMSDIGPFPEEDVEQVVKLAQRLEHYIRTGQ